jgi:DnaK suppressor protein
LDAKRIADFQRQLLEQREALLGLEAASAESAGTVELDQTRMGRLSRMDALQGQAMLKEKERRRGAALQRIDAALRRIEAGQYGNCLRCDEPIGVQRLQVDPANPLCIRCASEADAAGQ